MITITNLSKRILIQFDDPNPGIEVYNKGSLNIWSVGDYVYITDSTKLRDSSRITKGINSRSINWSSVVGMTDSMDLINLLIGYDDAYVPPSGNPSPNITSATVISAITTTGNWSTGSFVDPGGILAQITAGQVYIDTTNKVMYQYNGSFLSRWSINNLG